MKRFLLSVAIMLAVVSTAAAQGRPLKVLVLHDMEGLSGQNDWRMISHSYLDLYTKAQELLTNDVNAVVAGLYDGGATLVHIVDGHGSGNPNPDVLLDKLDPRAQHIMRDEPFEVYTGLVAPGAYDAVVTVAMHAKPGSKGFLSHTYTGGVEWVINGQTLTEPELIGFSWGRVGVPVIMVTGDDRLKSDLAPTMPWIEYVTVKTAKGAGDAELIPLDLVHLSMRAAAKRAVQNLSRMKAMKLEGPVNAAVRARPPASLSVLRGVPGVNYNDNAVSFTAPDFMTAYDGMLALVRVAGTGRTGLMMETLMKQPYGPQAQRTIGEAMTDRWLQYESGTWTPPPPVPPELQPKRKYHGAT